MEELENSTKTVVKQLTSNQAKLVAEPALTESQFRWNMNQDPMATEKLAEGIRNFAIDQNKLEVLLSDLF